MVASPIDRRLLQLSKTEGLPSFESWDQLGVARRHARDITDLQKRTLRHESFMVLKVLMNITNN
jgi:hypothetical protein